MLLPVVWKAVVRAIFAAACHAPRGIMPKSVVVSYLAYLTACLHTDPVRPCRYSVFVWLCVVLLVVCVCLWLVFLLYVCVIVFYLLSVFVCLCYVLLSVFVWSCFWLLCVRMFVGLVPRYLSRSFWRGLRAATLISSTVHCASDVRFCRSPCSSTT